MQRRDEDGVEAAAIAAVVPLDGKRVLEVGCGKGRLTALAAARASSVYAFDPSAESVAAARAALTSDQRRKVGFAVHDAEAHPGSGSPRSSQPGSRRSVASTIFRTRLRPSRCVPAS